MYRNIKKEMCFSFPLCLIVLTKILRIKETKIHIFSNACIFAVISLH